MHSLAQNCLITRVANAASAATTDVECSVVDMAGFESCTFIAALGDVTTGSVLALVCDQGTDATVTDAAELTGYPGKTAGVSDCDNLLLALDVVKPVERYLRCRLERGTANAVLDGIIAIQYNGKKPPYTQGDTVIDTEVITSPAEA